MTAPVPIRLAPMKSSPRIAVVEDDPEIRRLLLVRLQSEGFRADGVDGGSGLDRLLAAKGPPDLIVLDLMLPGEDGFSICRRLRAQSRVPIIMLTARGEDVDRIVGLELGADDYLPKPFNTRELIARIRAVLRRMEPDEKRVSTYNLGPLTIDADAREIRRADDGFVDVTAGEFDLLMCFLERPNRVLSREQLIEWTRGRNADPFDRTIDVQMSRLRRKLADVGLDNAIKTIRNSGYILALWAEGER
jgi:two-component system OmpR family response regulator